jgi:hypothetical protein
VLVTTALLFIGGSAKIVNNLYYLKIGGASDDGSFFRDSTIWAWRYFIFMAHWNLSLHYYSASVTCTEIFEAKAVSRTQRNLRIVFWTFTILAMASTAPLAGEIAEKFNAPLETAYLFFSMIPYAVTFILLILALKNIRAFLIKYGQRMRLH